MFAAYILFPEAAIFNIFQSEQVQVPEFINMSLDEAKELAETENVEIEVKDEVEDSSVAEGVILEQSPDARKKVKPGTVVHVTVSVGAEKILIDDFKSSKFDVAEAVLEDLGFFVDVTYENSDDIPENYVIRQNPPSGQKAAKGSTVTLVVSKGPEETEVVVPRFVGKTYEQAKKDIENASLALGEVSYEESVIDKGLVIR
jgi:serine/threonine-protein kinase